MKTLPAMAAHKPHFAFVLLTLFVFVFLPFFLIRQVLGVAIISDEERLAEEYRRAIKSDMASFIHEATPETQLQNALNNVLKKLVHPKISSENGLNEAWAKDFQNKVKSEFPFPPSELWIFGPELRPLLIEGTPRELQKKIIMIFAYCCDLGSFSTLHPEFLQKLRQGSPEEAYFRERLTRMLSQDTSTEVEKSMSLLVADVWSKFQPARFLKLDITHSKKNGATGQFNKIVPIITKNGRKFLAFLDWKKSDGTPLGGLLITFDATQISSSWVLSRTAHRVTQNGFHRSWSKFKRSRSERQWINNAAGLHWVDIPSQMPEMHIQVSLAKRFLQHPLRAYFPTLDFFLVALAILVLLLSIRVAWFDVRIPLRIHGQLNAALLIVAVVPFIGFVTVAFSYISMKTSLERQIALRHVESSLQEVEDQYRAFQMHALARFRKIRDKLLLLTKTPARISPFLQQVKKCNFAKYFFIRVQGNKEFSSVTASNPNDVALPIMYGLVEPVFKEFVPNTDGTAQAPPALKSRDTTQMKRSILAETLIHGIFTPQHYSSVLNGMNKLHMLSFGISNPAYVFLDMLRFPNASAPVGVVFFGVIASELLDEYLQEQLFRKNRETESSLGLDRMLIRGIGMSSRSLFPFGIRMTSEEQNLFQQVEGTRGKVVLDRFDRPGGGFSAAAPLRDATYIMIVRINGEKIRSHIRSLQAGVWALLLYAVGILAGIGFFLSGRFAFPLLTLKSAAESVEKNILDIRVDIRSDDEFGELATSFNSMTTGLRERERMTRYVSANLLETVKNEDHGQAAPVSRIDVTVMFSDIRGFTNLSEKHDAGEIVDLLNEYFTEMEAPILQHGGDIDKYVGDAIMAVFRAHPGEGKRAHAVRACRAALAMRQTLSAFNLRRKEEGLFPLENGIGLNSGEVISGQVGSRNGRLDHTVIGDTVNLAARLESESKRGTTTHIIISRSTFEAVEAQGEACLIDRVLVKGKDEPVEIFELLNM
ncbi:MAG: adenylate/guanylate cyclase domain-containing protein [Candidatus Ozemobacteraceae bacterium]